MRVMGIDPGKITGWACLINGRLAGLGVMAGKLDGALIHQWKSILEWHHPHQVGIEIPQVYPVQRWKGDPNDLIQVALVAGVLIAESMAWTNRIHLVKPREWKGTRPKDVTNAHTKSLLEAGELELVRGSAIPPGQLNHALDALGLAFHIAGRK